MPTIVVLFRLSALSISNRHGSIQQRQLLYTTQECACSDFMVPHIRGLNFSQVTIENNPVAESVAQTTDRKYSNLGPIRYVPSEKPSD